MGIKTTRPLVMTAAVAVVALMLIPGGQAPAQAQSRKEKAEEASKRSLEGLVTDEAENVVVGAVVKLKDMKTLQVRSFITKEDGKYHFYGLSINNDYEVEADFKGMYCKPRTLSVYDSRKKPNLDLKLEKKKS